MFEEGLERAALPAHALAPEDPQAARAFSPADRVRHEADRIRLAVLAHVPVDLDHQLHVLAHGIRAVAADLDDDAPGKDAEGPRDQHEAVEVAPAQAPDQERPEIFDDLQQRQELAREGANPNPPELVVEVVSDETSARELDTLMLKVSNYIHIRHFPAFMCITKLV